MQSEAGEAMRGRTQEDIDLAVQGEESFRRPAKLGGMRPDMAEFVGAFMVGAAIGAGAALLLRPAPKRGTERIRHDLAPYGKKLRKNAETARRNFAAGRDAASAAADALGEATRILMQDLREEVAEIVSSARDDLSDAVNDQVRQALKTIKRGTRLKGRR